MEKSWSRPAISPWLPVLPYRKPLPVYPPPESLLSSPPPLPSPPRKPAFNAPYTLSTHIFPAAYLRTTKYVAVPASLPPNATKAERKAHVEATLQQLKSLRSPSNFEPEGSPRVLWNCANRYVRAGLDEKENKAGGITLIFFHANGFPKEIFEPVLRYLLCSPAASIIDEVWSWESVQHGDAYLINGDKNGGLFDWTDNGRDILNFLNFYMPSKASSSKLPTHLTRVTSEESIYRQSKSFRQRKIIPVGHSYGGCGLIVAALNQPKLFTSLILIDPAIAKPMVDGNVEIADDLVRGAVSRREIWRSREEALRLLNRSPVFSSWDPACLAMLVECGTYDSIDPLTGQAIVKLKTPGIQEALLYAFSEDQTYYEVFERMPGLDERIELRWIVPSKVGEGEWGPAGSTRERVWVRPENSSNIRIPKTGHLIVQEAPQAVAREIEDFLQQRYLQVHRAHL